MREKNKFGLVGTQGLTLTFRHTQPDGRFATRGQVGVGRLPGFHRQGAHRPPAHFLQRPRAPLPLQQTKPRQVHGPQYQVSHLRS